MTEIKIKRKLLLDALMRLRTTFAKKSALPILNDYFFTVEGDKLSITVTDSETVSVETFSLPKGDIMVEEKSHKTWCVNRYYLVPGLRSLDDEEICLKVGDYQIAVYHGSGVFRMPIEDSSEFPTTNNTILGSSPIVNHLKLEAPGIFRWLNILRDSIAQGELRPVMNGVYFDCKPEGMTVCSSDGHTLVTVRKDSITTEQNENIIMPRKVAQILSSTLTKTGEVDFFFQTYHKDTLPYGKIRFPIGDEKDHTFEIRFIGVEGRYPNYNSVIPQNNDIVMSVDRLKLVRLMRRAIVFANSSTLMAKMTIEKDKLKVTSESLADVISCDESVSCEAKGNTLRLPMKIGLNISSVIKLVQKLNTSKICFKFMDPSRAILIEPEPQPEIEHITMLLMPMLLDE